MPNNPLPLLHKYCKVTIPQVAFMLPPRTPIDVAHKLFAAEAVTPWQHDQLRDYTLAQWGNMRDTEHRKELWRCYFPDTLPHVYHLLVYEHFHTDEQMTSASGYSATVIESILKQPKLHQRQLRRVARYATEYADAIGSRKRKHVPPDPRHMAIHRALRDKKRMYERGEIL